MFVCVHMAMCMYSMCGMQLKSNTSFYIDTYLIKKLHATFLINPTVDE